MTYSVRLDAFEGPLDLLLHLVSRERMDVAEISISAITEEFLRSIDPLQELDLDAASGFLVLAATLLELKSLKLLPRRVAVDPEVAALLEERDRLLHRLVEYST
ncbi:MAG: segregation/condensation protein A, partial [Actinomycetota bacterium]